MICPICNELVNGPPSWAEDVFHNSACECGAYSIDYWDREIQQETVEVWLDFQTYRIVFDRAKNETAVYKVYRHERDDYSWTEHVITVPPLQKIPNESQLRKKIKVWLTFQ